MTSLISYISSDYQKAINSLKPKTSENSVLVYVEGNEDISFWRNILSPYEREISIKFEVKPYSKDSLATGKRNLEKIFSQTGKYLLIALDSDYDYLFPDHSDISQKINSNPYIFQTYSYSIENLKCYAESLHGVCVDTTFVDKAKIDFVQLLKLYSNIVYDLFIWNLYFYHVNKEKSFTISSFCDVIKIVKSPNINEHGVEALNTLESHVQDKLQELQNDFPEDYVKLNDLANQLTSRGLERNNCYLFIHGHTLYDNVILMFMKPICRILKNEKIDEIKRLSKSTQEWDNQLNKYNNDVGKQKIDTIVETTLAKNDKFKDFKDCFLFQKIKDDIINYIKLFG
jgi:hypothetical protein